MKNGDSRVLRTLKTDMKDKQFITMDYENAYKEALERAKDIIMANPDSAVANVISEDIFPELRESKGEKTRKELIRYIPYCDDISRDTKERWIAWLENQGEQKPAWKDEQYAETIKTAEDHAYFAGSEAMRKTSEKQMTAFAIHLQRRGAFRDDLCMDFEHEAQSFIEMQKHTENPNKNLFK